MTVHINRMSDKLGAVPTVGGSNPDGDVIVTVTRPANATPYSAGDVVGEIPAKNLIFPNVSKVEGGDFLITSLISKIFVAAIPAGMTNFELHLFNAPPTPIADNAPFVILAEDEPKYLGSIIINTPAVKNGRLYVQMDNINLKKKLAPGSTTIYGQKVTLGSYTPTSGAIKTIQLNTLGV